MKKIFFSILLLTFSLSATSRGEVGGYLIVGIYDKIDHSSLGVGGVIYPQSYKFDRLSLGFDFSLQLVERFLYDNTPQNLDTLWDESGNVESYVLWYNKVYRDYLFIPLGMSVRYDLRDPNNLSIIRPSLTLGIGGILNIYQQSYRRIQDYFEVYPSNPGISPDNRYMFDIAGESISTFDFYLKPGIVFSWNRITVGYEYLFNTEYMRHNINIGYTFRL